MSLNLKVLALAAFAAGFSLAGSADVATAQSSHGRGNGQGQMDRNAPQNRDKDKDKGRADRRDDDDRRVVISQREREARARIERERVIRERERQRQIERARDERNRGRAGQTSKNGKGPSFCRAGSGHPVYGRSWCIDKGFGLGEQRWGRQTGDWDDVVFGRTGRASSRTGTVGSGTLSDILGRVIYGRLQQQSSRLGGAPLTGRWLQSNDGPLVLQVQSGSRPLAEFVDRNRDGRTDVVFLNLGR